MLTRILTAVVALLLLVPLLIFGGEWGACGLFALIAGFSVFEMLGCCGLLKKYIISIPAILISVFTVILPMFQLPYTASYLIAILPFLIVIVLMIGVLDHKNMDIERVLMFVCLAVYITAGFTSLSYMRGYIGLWAVVLVLAVSWSTDTFAYFSGMLFGKKKLCPEISPKKTVAGAIGGTLFGTLAGIIVTWIAIGKPERGFIALPLSIVSQLGDLAASVIKRKFGVKDYGKIFPGHGGVLDRFDSIIPVSIMTGVMFLSYLLYTYM